MRNPLNKERGFLYFDRVIMVCLCAAIFCLPFAKSAVETFVWTAIFLWMLKRALGYRSEELWMMLPKTELNNALMVFFAVNAVSMILSVNFALSWRGLFGKEFKFIAIYFIMLEVISSRIRLRTFLTFIIASAVLIMADAGIQYFRGVDFLKGYVLNTFSASFSTTNSFAAWLIVIIPLFLGLLATSKIIGKSFKVLLLILTALMTTCLLITYSRGAWLGFLIAICLVFWYLIKNFALKTKLLCLTSGICLLFIFLFSPQPIQSRIEAFHNWKLGQTVGQRIKSSWHGGKNPLQFRFNLWKEALRITRDYPLTGCGLNTYSIVVRNYKSFEGGAIYPHNSYLQMAAETGLLGLGSFLWVLFVFFRKGFRFVNNKRNPLVLGLISGIMAFLIQSFFDTNLYSLQLVVLFWFMMGLAMAVIKIEGENTGQ